MSIALALITLTTLSLAGLMAQEAPTMTKRVYVPLAVADCVEPTGYDMNYMEFTLQEPGYWFSIRHNPCGGTLRYRTHWFETVHCPNGCWGPWVTVDNDGFAVRIVQAWPGTTRIYDQVQFVDWSGWSFGVRAYLLATP